MTTAILATADDDAAYFHAIRAEREAWMLSKAEEGAVLQGRTFTAIWRLLNGIRLERGDVTLIQRALKERPRG